MGQVEDNTELVVIARHVWALRGRRPWHVRKHLAREPGDPIFASLERVWRPHWEVQGRKTMMNEYGKSDNSIVPKKLPNNTQKGVAEAMEGRGLAKGNSLKRNAPRTQGRVRAQSALKRIRQAA